MEIYNAMPPFLAIHCKKSSKLTFIFTEKVQKLKHYSFLIHTCFKSGGPNVPFLNDIKLLIFY